MELVDIRDQDYLILQDKTILTIHGWNHPAGYAVGEVTFIPDTAGQLSFFGTNYRKAHQENGHGTPEVGRRTRRVKTGTFYDDSSLFATKSIIDFADVLTHIDVSDIPAEAVDASAMDQSVCSILADNVAAFNGQFPDLQVGLTGSLRLHHESRNRDIKAHDVDLTYTGSVQEIALLVKELSRIPLHNPKMRLWEYGKGWRVRMQTKNGILCPFFRYSDPTYSPLHGLEMTKVISRQVTVDGVVTGDAHNAYMPAYITIAPTACAVRLPISIREQMPIIITHMRSKGDFFSGDNGTFTGDIVELNFGTRSQMALVVHDGNQSVLMSPPWQPF